MNLTELVAKGLARVRKDKRGTHVVITATHGDIDIAGDPSIVSVGLPDHKSGNVWCHNDPQLRSLSLPAHKSGYVLCSNDPQLRVLSLPRHESGYVWCHDDPRLRALSLPNHQAGSVDCHNDPQLRSLSLPRHKSGYVDCSNDPRLTSLSLPRHKSGGVWCHDDPQLRSLSLPRHESGYVWCHDDPRLRALSLPDHKSGYVWCHDDPQLTPWVEKKYGKTTYPIYFSGVLKDGRAMFDNLPCRVVGTRKLGGLTVYSTDNPNLPIVVYDGENYAHGETIAEAKSSLIYKLANHDTTPYTHWRATKAKIKTAELIRGYRAITGACEAGVRNFAESLPGVKNSYTIKELIELTSGQFGNQKLVEFVKERK